MNKYRILIVEDDSGIADGVVRLLTSWGMEAEKVKNLRNVSAEFAAYNPHLVLMDVYLPFMDGYYWCREIRQVSSVPIIFLSSASDNMNIVMAMNMGADDFIAKPFDGNVLAAKIQALLRRTYTFSEITPICEHRGVMLNTNDHSLFFQDQQIELSKNEYRILFVLMKNIGKVVSREKLMEALWQTDAYVDENTLTVNVGRLRKKLEAAELNDFIKTKFGKGYLID